MQATGPLGRTTRYRHDARGRTVEVIDAKGGSKRLAWDEADRLMAYTDCSGQTTRYTYDGMGRPLTRIDAAGRILAYHYDRAGRLIALDNENYARTHFRYDLRDQLTDEVGFDGRWQRYIYNAAGELTHVIEAGGSDAGPGKVTSSSAMPCWPSAPWATLAPWKKPPTATTPWAA
ncbi:MAG: hypothetical protein ACN6PP_05685 [Delftia tsuruhatensis]